MCCATGSLNMLNPSLAFVSGEPTSQSCGKFTEMPRFPYMFVNLGTAKELRCPLRYPHNGFARLQTGFCLSTSASSDHELLNGHTGVQSSRNGYPTDA